MTTLPLRESVLEFMTSNQLVSCTVTAPGRRPQEEYRIAAIQLKFNPHHFVISKKTNVRLRG